MKYFLRTISLFLFVSVVFVACKSTQPNTTQNQENKLSKNDTTDTDTFLIPVEEEAAQWEKKGETPQWVSKTGAYQAESTRKFHLKHTRLALTPDWEKQYVYALATLTLQAWFYPQNELVLDAKGFDIESITLLSNNEKKALKYKYDGQKLQISLGRAYTREENFKIAIKYIAKPNELMYENSTFTGEEKGLYFINPQGKIKGKPTQIWSQGETQNNSCWFPTFDVPNIKMSQDVLITVDDKYVTLSNGKLISSQKQANGKRTDHWKQEKPHSPYLTMIAVGEFAVVKDKWKGKEVSYYVESEYKQYARDIFGKTPKMMRFFSAKFNYDFPWEKYAQVVVRDYTSGAMENTGATVMMAGVQVNKRSIADHNWEEIIAHELIHQWFGDLVTAESWANLTLNEAFGTYGEYLWLEEEYGKDEAAYWWQEELADYLDEAIVKREPIIRYRHLDKEEMFDSHTYAKGALVLHMLRDYVGDEAFFEAISQYLKQNEFKNSEIHTLRLAFENVVGEDLNWFFEQWFMFAGHPELTVNKVYKEGILTLDVTQEQDSKYAPIYRLPLHVSIWVKGIEQIHQITITQDEQEFNFQLDTVPDLVVFDSHIQLLSEIDLEKSDKEWLFQLKYTKDYLSRLAAVDALHQNIANKEVGEGVFVLLSDKFWATRMMAIRAYTDYQGENSIQVVEKLKKMALEDKNSSVRASAIDVISSLGNFPELLEKTLQDQSYFVISNSLYAYAALEGVSEEEVLTQMQKFEEMNERHIVYTLADAYSSYQTPDKYDWFEKKLSKKSGEELGYLLNQFGAYIQTQDEASKQKAIIFLANLAKYDNNYEIRQNTYQTILLMGEIEGREAILQDIRDHEKDRRVKDFHLLLNY